MSPPPQPEPAHGGLADARLLCWNVAGRVTRLPEQAALVSDLAPDLVCLQEVRPTTRDAWSLGLESAGCRHVESAPLAATAAQQGRRLMVLTAARRPLRPLPLAALPWPERALAVRVAGAQLINVHSPISTKPGLVKVLTHEALHAHLAGGSGPRILCGDLNTPRREHADGRIWTFARDRYGRLRPERGERWDEAELALIQGLEPYGFRDGFRALHGRAVRELSWEWPQWGGGYRLDHLIVSEDVEVLHVEYLHDWRRAGLSDHSPLLAHLRWHEPRETG